ncbi:hypothetical protein K8T06_00415, partial [bacterium]|nr:hypothetical protein [bacterium]
ISIEQSLCGPDFTNQTGVRITALEWHPTEQMGLMAGGNRWIFKFEDDQIPTPTPTPTSNTPTPTSPPLLPIPTTGTPGILMLLVCFCVILMKKN